MYAKVADNISMAMGPCDPVCEAPVEWAEMSALGLMRTPFAPLDRDIAVPAYHAALAREHRKVRAFVQWVRARADSHAAGTTRDDLGACRVLAQVRRLY